MLLAKPLLIFFFCQIFAGIFTPTNKINGAVIRNLQQNKNHLKVPTDTKREAERSRFKTYKIIAEHIGPSVPTSSGEEQSPKFDSIEIEEKNVDTVEEVFTALEEVLTNTPSADRSKRNMAENPDSNLYDNNNDEHGGFYIEDPGFRNRRSKYASIIVRPFDSDFDEISNIFPKFDSMRAKDLKKRVYYAIEDLSNNSSPSGNSKNMENKFANSKDDSLNQSRGHNNIFNASESLKRQSPNAKKGRITTPPFQLQQNYNKNFGTKVTTQPQTSSIFLNSRNDTKRTFGYQRNQTKFVDLNNPKLNFSYEAKPGDEIVLRKDRQGPKSSNQSERTKKDDFLKKVDKEVDIYEEIIDSSGDNLNNSNAVPNIEDDAMKLAEPLIKVENVSGGRLQWNIREDAGGPNHFKSGNQREAPGEVIYVQGQNNRKVVCDSFLKQLFNSNLFLASFIFVLIVTVIYLFLMVIYNIGMRSYEKNKYKKLISKEFGYRAGKVTKRSKSVLGIKTAINSALFIGRGLLCMPILSSEESRTQIEYADFRKDTKCSRSNHINETKCDASSDKMQRKGNIELDDSESQLQHEQKQEKHPNDRTQMLVTRKLQIPEEEHISCKTRKEVGVRSSSYVKDTNFETPTKGRATAARKNQKSENKGENSEKQVKKCKGPDENRNGKRYSIHKHLSNEGPIISYTRIQKRRPKESDSFVNVKESKHKEQVWSGKANESSSTSNDSVKSKVVDWLQRKYSAISSGASSSSDNEELVKTKSSKNKSEEKLAIGTKIKDMFLGLGTSPKEGTIQSSDESDTVEKRRERKTFKIKKNSSKMSRDQKIDLESMTTDVEFSSSDEQVLHPPPKPKELVSKIVVTGDCKKIDVMLRGHGWQRSLYCDQGIRTLDDGTMDSHQHDTMASHQQGTTDNYGGAVKTTSSLLALQNEVGRFINIAEENSPAASGK